MDPRAIYQAAKSARDAFEVDGVTVSLEVRAALAALRPVEVNGEVLFSPLGTLHPRRLVVREVDGMNAAVLEKV